MNTARETGEGNTSLCAEHNYTKVHTYQHPCISPYDYVSLNNYDTLRRNSLKEHPCGDDAVMGAHGVMNVLSWSHECTVMLSWVHMEKNFRTCIQVLQ